jgi:L-amino acid N-acyltransferase YncA
MQIRSMTSNDWSAVQAIHAEGIATGDATFQPAPPTSWREFDVGKLESGRLVAITGERVVGWVAVSPTSTRQVYEGVVEQSIYVTGTARGQGVGAALLDELIAATEAAGIWTIQANLFPENTASLALHDRAGFRRVGTRERIGRMSHGPFVGQWRDTVLIERRSTRLL